ncbi:MAG TPA: molybdate ABC transporter substrate-binding protein [Microbacterium sp.]|uniref:molybdate ABC transporter substrate-binding protein n=1 Tax=Microbacterium sp. TaxID=51671 RepID=UPI002B49AFEB|nr:molybdate ABC transporter substrate-binding protein [Microbacterium sp.]HKT55721.1 molybdate ABC transporter substrate-binding protein [Microbacterium sp.]
MKTPRLLGVAAVAVTISLSVAGCSGAPAAGGTTSPSAAASTLSGDLTISAAASLSGAFDELAAEFHAKYPGVTVKPINYDGSSVLATQIIQGAPVDVFASADVKNMTKVTAAKLTVKPVDFATNTMEIATRPGNPLGITGLGDLAKTKAGKAPTVVLCAPAVPCGNASKTLLADAKVAVTPASEEQNVTAVLTKVESGDADAGLVYVTDVKAAGAKVAGVPIANADAAVNTYPLSVLTGAQNPAAAAAFVTFVTSPEGQKVLASFGFGRP